jgi:MFS family permease
MSHMQDNTESGRHITPVNGPGSLWGNRDYMLLWSGQALSDIGGAVSELALPLLVLAVTHSAAQAGFIAALRALPASFLGLLAGMLVDRWNRKWVMFVCEVGRAFILASIVVAYVWGHLSIWQLAITALLEGSLSVVFMLAKTTVVPQIVAPEQLTMAVTQEEFVEGTTALFGPSLAGVLYTLNAILPFLTDAISYVISLISILLMRVPAQTVRAVKTKGVSRGRMLWREITEGAIWVWRQPFILTMTLLMGASAFVLRGSTLIIIILAQQQHVSAFVIGLIFATGGIGAILGSLLVTRLQRYLSVGQSIMLVRWYYVLSWPLYALAPYAFVFAAMMFGEGFVDPIEDVPYFSHRLRLIPDKLKGRVISVCRLVPGIMRPLGLALTGILIQRIGVYSTIWLMWMWLLATTAIVTVIPQIRRERAF